MEECNEEKKNKNLFQKIITNPMLYIMIAIILFRIGYHSFFQEYSTYTDTKTYFESYEGDIWNGKIDRFRTPVYPELIRLIAQGETQRKVVFPSVVLMQEIISLLSVIVFYMTFRKIVKSKKIAYVATIFYGCLPMLLELNLCILTESLSISLLVFFFGILMSYLQKPKVYKTIFLSIYTFFLIMLRPSFLYLLIVLGILWFLKLIIGKRERIKALIGIVTIGIVLVGISQYENLNLEQNEFKGISVVTVINQLDTIVENDLYYQYEPKDQDFYDLIKDSRSEKEKIWHLSVQNVLFDKKGYSKVGEFNSRCLDLNKEKYLQILLNRITDRVAEPLNQTYAELKDKTNIHKIELFKAITFPLNFGILYLMLIGEGIYFLCYLIKKKDIQWQRFSLLLLIGGLLGTTLLGAQAEYQRLITPIIPFVIMLLFLYLEKCIEIGKRYLRKDKNQEGKHFIEEEQENTKEVKQEF